MSEEPKMPKVLVSQPKPVVAQVGPRIRDMMTDAVNEGAHNAAMFNHNKEKVDSRGKH